MGGDWRVDIDRGIRATLRRARLLRLVIICRVLRIIGGGQFRHFRAPGHAGSRAGPGRQGLPRQHRWRRRGPMRKHSQPQGQPVRRLLECEIGETSFMVILIYPSINTMLAAFLFIFKLHA